MCLYMCRTLARVQGTRIGITLWQAPDDVRVQADSLVPGYKLHIISCHLRIVRYALLPIIAESFYREWRLARTVEYWYKTFEVAGPFAIAANISSVETVLARTKRPLATLLFFVHTNAALGVQILNAFNFVNANVSHAQLLWDSGAKRCPQDKPYEMSFGTGPLKHDDNVNEVLYEFYEIIGRNNSNTDTAHIDRKAWMHGVMFLAFRFSSRPLHTTTNEHETSDGILQLRARFRMPTSQTLNLYALSIYQTSFFYNFDHTITLSPP